MNIPCSTVLLASLLLFCQLALGQHPNRVARKGNELYQSGKYKDAEASYRKSLEEKKSLSEANYNLGNALLRQGKTAEATEVYKSTIASEGSPKLKQKAWHNLGTMHLKDKNWEEGAKAFSEALKLNPADEDSRYNLAYAKAMMKQAQQNQNKDKKDDKKNDQDKNKKQEEKDGGKGDDKNKDKKNKDKKGDNKDNEQDESARKDKKNEQKMSKEDAERLLNALASKERDLHKKMNRKKNTSPASAVQIEKDW